MDILKLLEEIFQVCIIPLLGILTTYFVSYIKAKREEIQFIKENALADKYTQMLTDTIIDCVKATNQTYVESLKNKNAFTAEAQKEALQMSYESIMTILSEDAVKYLDSMYGDLNTYIMAQIEAQVNKEKK